MMLPWFVKALAAVLVATIVVYETVDPLKGWKPLG